MILIFAAWLRPKKNHPAALLQDGYAPLPERHMRNDQAVPQWLF